MQNEPFMDGEAERAAMLSNVDFVHLQPKIETLQACDPFVVARIEEMAKKYGVTVAALAQQVSGNSLSWKRVDERVGIFVEHPIAFDHRQPEHAWVRGEENQYYKMFKELKERYAQHRYDLRAITREILFALLREYRSYNFDDSVIPAVCVEPTVKPYALDCHRILAATDLRTPIEVIPSFELSYN